MGLWAVRAVAAALAAAALCAAAASTAAGGPSLGPSLGSSPAPAPSAQPPASPSPPPPQPSPSAPLAAPAPVLVRHARLATRDIQRFRSYRDVSVLPLDVPENTRLASFNFTVKEVATSAIAKKCPPRNVTVALKFGSYPVVNPDGARFPERYETRRLPYYEGELLSDGQPRAINVSNPLPGDWYAVAFLSYTDPNDDKILQQGLSASCVALLEAAVDVTPPEEVVALEAGRATAVRAEGRDAAALSRLFRTFAPAGARSAHVELTPAACSRAHCPALSLAARPRAFPGAGPLDGGADTRRVACTPDDACQLEMAPHEAAWLYVAVEADAGEADKDLLVGYYVNVSFGGGADWTAEPLMRQSFVQLFMYNFVRVPDVGKPSDPNQPPAVNVSTATATILSFDVFPVKDVGGTLTLELRLDQTPALLNSTAPAPATASDAAPTPATFNVSVVACLSYASKRLPQFPDSCVDATTKSVFPASVRLNTTAPDNFTGKLHLPFPEPGAWFLALRPFCFVANGSEPALVDCGELNETQVAFVLDSEMCGADGCGRWGHCNNYLSGGVIFATCVCQHGYRGWGCTDDQRIDKLSDLLLASLLLTLSNLPFLGAAMVALRRGYLTEAFVYFCTLFFSTFYHACEAGEDVYYYCLMPLHVLQFCDFFSAILALWVTLVAMADVPPAARSLLHMAGAVGVALGTEYDRTSLSVFMVPTLLGLGLMIARWAMRCRAQRACYPHKSYWIFCFPPGVVLVVVGVVCFSFLQTRSNYKFVHSAWHSMMAVAIILVLPSREHRAFESVESDDSVDSTEPFWRRTKWCGCRSCR